MTTKNRRPHFVTSSGFDFADHYDCPLSILGLSQESDEEDIADAADREMEDLNNNHGDEHGVTWDELNDFLAAWVTDEAEATR